MVVVCRVCHNFNVLGHVSPGCVPSGIGPTAPAHTAEAAAEPKPKSPEEWVETLVQQMAGARDMADARSRAASVLQNFQQAVLDTSHVQVSR